MCLKHHHYLCEACLSCSDPDLYCKFRQSCAIHFLEKERRRLEKQDKAAE